MSGSILVKITEYLSPIYGSPVSDDAVREFRERHPDGEVKRYEGSYWPLSKDTIDAWLKENALSYEPYPDKPGTKTAQIHGEIGAAFQQPLHHISTEHNIILSDAHLDNVIADFVYQIKVTIRTQPIGYSYLPAAFTRKLRESAYILVPQR